MDSYNKGRRDTMAKELIAELDRAVNKLSHLEYYDLADRLEELVGDIEEHMIKEGVEF